jgi:hypothetical protein
MKKVCVISKNNIEYKVSPLKAKYLIDKVGAKLKDGENLDLEEKKQTAQETAKEITGITNIKELEKYKGDTRQVVVNAYNKKLKELS